MTWYRTGTANVVAGSTAVGGIGTLWNSQAKAGEAFLGPDGALYEIQSISSDTGIVLRIPYAGPTFAGGQYAIVPTQSYMKVLSSQVSDLLAIYQTVPSEAVEAAIEAAVAEAQEVIEAAQGSLDAKVGAATTAANAAEGSASQAAAVLANALTKSEVAAATGATKIGTTDGTVQDALDARAKTSVLASAVGAQGIGVAGGGNVQDALNALPTSPEVSQAVQGRVDLHNSDAEAHPELSAFISSEANRAQNAASAALIQAGVAVDEPSGRAAVADGIAFKTQGFGDVAAYEYRRITSTSSQFLTSYPSTSFVQKVDQRNSATRSFLTTGGLLRFKGSGSIFPLLVDMNNRVVFGYDVLAGAMFGRGMVTIATLPTNVKGVLGSMNAANYKGGTASIVPLVIDAGNRVLLWWDVPTKRWKGPGISDSSAVAAVSGAAPLLDLTLKPIHKAINHLLFYGQSLSVGAQGTTILSTTQPYQNKTFVSGPRAAGGDYSAMKPLVEDALPAPDGASNRGETVCSGAANYATTLAALDGRDPANHVIFASTAGHGGYRIDQLNAASAWYSQLLAHVSGAHALNADHAVHAIGWIQGENDAVSGTNTPYATYRAALAQLQIDMDTSIKAITGQTAPVYVLTYQLSYAARTWADQAKAQLDLAQKNDRFVLVTPTYHLPHHTDNVHLTSIGYKWMGAYFGRAYKQLVIDGKRPKWINPVSATRRGKVIRVRFDVPYGPLVLDTTTLAVTTDHGFKVLDGSSAAAISSITVSGSDLLVTLADLPSGAVKFRAGLDYLAAGLSITGGASTNLRDSDPSFITIGSTNYPLYNVCPHFEMPVVALGE